MITDARLEELRTLVEAEPEGSLAKILLAVIDEIKAEEKKERRRAALASLKRRGHTDEESELLISNWEAGKPIETEEVECWLCEGYGQVLIPGCSGSGLETCQTCNGDGRTWRYKTP